MSILFCTCSVSGTMLRKIALTGPMFAATAVKVEETKVEAKEKVVAKCRPKDLPLYTPLYPEEKY